MENTRHSLIIKLLSLTVVVILTTLSFSGCNANNISSNISSAAPSIDSSPVSTNNSNISSSIDSSNKEKIEAEELVFKIGDKLPTVKCIAVTDKNKTEVYSIKVTNADTGNDIQILDLPYNSQYAKHLMYYLDVTFSGENSLLVPHYDAAYFVKFYAFRWDRSQQKFVMINGFQDISNPVLNFDEKTIYSHWSGDQITNYHKYIYNGNDLISKRTLTWYKDVNDIGEKTAFFKEYENDAVIKDFTIPCDEYFCFDRDHELFKQYGIEGSNWDIDSNKWHSPSIRDSLEIYDY